MSCPVRGAWIEKEAFGQAFVDLECRAPYGARGLKQQTGQATAPAKMSCPVRGAWIETSESRRGRQRRARSCPVRGAWIETKCRCLRIRADGCRAPYGARGLKQDRFAGLWPCAYRAPYGARGLKHRRLLHRRPARHVVPRNPASISTRHWRGLGNAITRRITPEGGG